jgi:hypothetical protein
VELQVFGALGSMVNIVEKKISILGKNGKSRDVRRSIRDLNDLIPGLHRTTLTWEGATSRYFFSKRFK